MKDTDNTLQTLLDKSFDNFDLTQGSLIKANVLEIGKKWVTLDIGFKSDGLVSIEEFQDHKNELVVEVGDQVEVVLDALDDGFGEIRLSREKARKQETWDRLQQSHEDGVYVEGKVVNSTVSGLLLEMEQKTEEDFIEEDNETAESIFTTMSAVYEVTKISDNQD